MTDNKIVDQVKSTGSLLRVVLAIVSFLEKVTVPFLILLTQRAKQQQRQAEDQVAVYQAKEGIDEARKAVDAKNAGKSSRRILLDFLGRKD